MGILTGASHPLPLHHPSSYLSCLNHLLPSLCFSCVPFQLSLLCQTDRNHHQTDSFFFYVSFPLRPAASYHLGDPFTSIPPLPLYVLQANGRGQTVRAAPLDWGGASWASALQRGGLRLGRLPSADQGFWCPWPSVHVDSVGCWGEAVPLWPGLPFPSS